MPVQGLGVQQAALAVAAPERRGGRARVLGVATASTSTVVPLGRLRRAAGAHLARRSRQMQGEAAPAFPAAATGCPARLPRRATLQRAWPALGHAPPAHLREFVAEEKLRPERQLVTDI